MAKSTKSAADILSGDTVVDLSSRLRDLTGAAEKGFGDVVGIAEDSLAQVRDFVEDEPWKAVAIAGAVGLLVGLLARR